MVKVKLLSGAELADYIKERQAKQVRSLRQSAATQPRLAIVQTVDDPVIDTYVRMKRRYGEDILVEVDIHRVSGAETLECIQKLNQDTTVHGIIIQLPLASNLSADDALNCVARHKDVDGLAAHTDFTAATAQAIDWLLHGYNIELQRRRIAIVGNGRLVGAPLSALWKEQGYTVTVYDENSKNMHSQLRRADVIVSAAGVPGLLQTESIRAGAIVVDAATSAEHGKVVGDVADEVRERSDITITPLKGGVGPLTVASLFDNVIRAARASVEATTQASL